MRGTWWDLRRKLHTTHYVPLRVTRSSATLLAPGLTSDLEPATVRYFREVEVKHGRVAMLGALGFVVGESFHPLFGGGIDVPSYVAYQQTPLQEFWPSVVLSIGVFEFFSITTIEGFGVKEEFPDGQKRIAGKPTPNHDPCNRTSQPQPQR